MKRVYLLFLAQWPLLAWSTSLGDIAQITTHLLAEVSDLGNVVLFITGGAFLISSMIKFQQYYRSPQFTPISRPIIELVAGIVLIALPFILAITADNAIYEKRH